MRTFFCSFFDVQNAECVSSYGLKIASRAANQCCVPSPSGNSGIGWYRSHQIIKWLGCRDVVDECTPLHFLPSPTCLYTDDLQYYTCMRMQPTKLFHQKWLKTCALQSCHGRCFDKAPGDAWAGERPSHWPGKRFSQVWQATSTRYETVCWSTGYARSNNWHRKSGQAKRRQTQCLGYCGTSHWWLFSSHGRPFWREQHEKLKWQWCRFCQIWSNFPDSVLKCA